MEILKLVKSPYQVFSNPREEGPHHLLVLLERMQKGSINQMFEVLQQLLHSQHFLVTKHFLNQEQVDLWMIGRTIGSLQSQITPSSPIVTIFTLPWTLCLIISFCSVLYSWENWSQDIWQKSEFLIIQLFPMHSCLNILHYPQWCLPLPYYSIK